MHATAAAVSHLQVVVAASVDTSVALKPEAGHVVDGSGFVMRTVGAASTVKLPVPVALPNALVAFTLNVWVPVGRVFGGSGEAGHGFCHAPLSHQQTTLVAPLVV